MHQLLDSKLLQPQPSHAVHDLLPLAGRLRETPETLQLVGCKWQEWPLCRHMDSPRSVLVIHAAPGNVVCHQHGSDGSGMQTQSCTWLT